MAVYDRWHKSRPKPGEPVCREHKMVPAAGHGTGDRWQVRWRDEDGGQHKRNFAKKAGKDPEKHADAFDAKVKTQLDDGSYVDPSSANVTLRAFAEDWRKSRTHGTGTAGHLERRLRLHVYPVIGQRTMRELGKRPSLIQAWIAGLRLAPSSARLVIRDVSSVFLAAIDDGIVTRNPVQVKSVSRPKIPEHKARPWMLAQVDAMAAALPERYSAMVYLGAAAGLRQGEMFGLAVEDIDFLRRVIHVRRQVKLIGNTPYFAPVKNDKAHDVPLAESLAPVLAEHIRQFPPVTVTLPWEPDGNPVTFNLVFTRPGIGNVAMNRTRFNESDWWPAQVKAGIVPPTAPGDKRAPARDKGMHALRHTAASAWLSAGVGVPAVAAWLGDTEATILGTYAHFMPDDDDRGRRAMDAFFQRCAPDVPSVGSLDA
jgi:integrase